MPSCIIFTKNLGGQPLILANHSHEDYHHAETYVTIEHCWHDVESTVRWSRPDGDRSTSAVHDAGKLLECHRVEHPNLALMAEFGTPARSRCV